MRWITQEPEFRDIFLRAREGVYIDSARTPTTLRRLLFDDAEICTRQFANLLQKLMEYSGDAVAHYIVLDPDPVHYFHRHFDKFPVVEIPFGEVPEMYLSSLNEDPGGRPADAIGTNWWACAIIPPSIKWFVHALRSERDDSGHLWVPSDYLDRVREVYPYAHSASPQ